MSDRNYAIGSIWRKWDPHLHTPGTMFNDQYGSSEQAWNEFLCRIEKTDIKALGITDYYTLGNYEKVLDYQKQGRLSNIDLIFPNIELRLAIGLTYPPKTRP